MEKLPEQILIERIRAGERNLFHELIRPYERRSFLIAYSVLRNSEDAEDAVQQGMLKIFTNLEQLEDGSKFPQWALRIVENEARMYRRKLHQDLYDPFDGDSSADGQSKEIRPRQFADWRELPNEMIEQGEIRDAIRAALDSLPDIYREVIVLRDMDHMNVLETAEILKVSVPVVKTRLHRARLMMREALSPIFAKPRVSVWERWKGINPWFAARR